jgi:hypothetical protein
MKDEQKPLSKTRFSLRVALWLKKRFFWWKKSIHHSKEFSELNKKRNKNKKTKHKNSQYCIALPQRIL